MRQTRAMKPLGQRSDPDATPETNSSFPVAAYAEFMVRSYHDDRSMIAFRDGLVDAIPARVEAATRETGRQAAAIRARHGQRMKLPDALIVATAIVVGADHILTANARWPVQDVPVTVLEGR